MKVSRSRGSNRSGWHIAALALLIVSITPVMGQNYPVKPIRLVVGFPPGGGADAAARVVAQKLQETWKQSVVVDNRAGAGGILAAEIVARSNPDGYSLLITSPGPVAINPSFMKLPYDPRKQLTPITLVASGPNVLVVHPASSAASLGDVIALARGSSKRLNYGSSGVGTTPHLSAELLKMMAKVDMVHVAYKGAGPAVIDLVGGRIDLMIVSAPTVLTQIRAQRLRALAVTTLKRSSALPDVPTFSEAGVPGYEAGVWWGLLAPAGTPAALTDKLHQAVAAILQTADARSRIAAEGADVVGNTPKAFGEFIQKETIKWAAVVKAAGIKVD